MGGARRRHPRVPGRDADAAQQRSHDDGDRRAAACGRTDRSRDSAAGRSGEVLAGGRRAGGFRRRCRTGVEARVMTRFAHPLFFGLTILVVARVVMLWRDLRTRTGAFGFSSMTLVSP